MNKVTLHGRLAKDPDQRTTSTGKAVTSFCVAVDRRVAKDSPKQADFINCVAWDKTAEVIGQYLFKGSELVVEGRLQVRSYEDSNGQKKYVTEVVVNEFEFCGSKSQQSNDNSVQSEFGSVTFEEEIPF